MEIARALCTDPALLLLDEPAAGLRHKEKQALAPCCASCAGEGMSILLVEHDMDLVMEPDRPHRGDGVRHQADRGHARRSAGQPGGARRLPRHGTLSHEH
jgi:ABC-type lipoprotein export system ATPase subunit